MINCKFLKNKNIKELKNILFILLRESFNIRMQLLSNDFKKTHLINKIKKNIAKVKTFIWLKKYEKKNKKNKKN